MNERKCSTWHREHHNWEEPCHEHPRRFISGKEAPQITMYYFTCCIREITKLEPSDRIDYMVQTERNQQTIGYTKHK
ncbi:hypothetical protein D3C81_1553070 [compost metagenome]